MKFKLNKSKIGWKREETCLYIIIIKAKMINFKWDAQCKRITLWPGKGGSRLHCLWVSPDREVVCLSWYYLSFIDCIHETMNHTSLFVFSFCVVSVSGIILVQRRWSTNIFLNEQIHSFNILFNLLYLPHCSSRVTKFLLVVSYCLRIISKV